MIYGMSEPTQDQKLTDALTSIATLGTPIRDLVNSIDKLTKKIDELISVERDNPRS